MVAQAYSASAKPRRRWRRKKDDPAAAPTRHDFARACAGLEDERLKYLLSVVFNSLNKAEFDKLVRALDEIDEGRGGAETVLGPRLASFLERKAEERGDDHAHKYQHGHDRKHDGKHGHEAQMPAWCRMLIESFTERNEKPDPEQDRQRKEEEQAREARKRNDTYRESVQHAHDMCEHRMAEELVPE